MAEAKSDKIKPKEYARILAALKLESLYLEKGSFKVNR